MKCKQGWRKRDENTDDPDQDDDPEHLGLLGPGSQGCHDHLVPLHGESEQGEDGDTDGEVGAELRY